MKLRYIWQLLLLFCVFSQTLHSQSVQKIRFNNIRKSEGLSNNMVNGIIRDNLGFLWIATNDGLCRYDGPNQLEIFRVSYNESSNILKSSNIRSIYEDSKGNLWLGTRLGGLTRYNRQNDNWKTFQYDKNKPNTISNDEILSILEDSQGRLWVGTENGLNLFDYETETFTRFLPDDSNPYSLKTKAVLDVVEDDKGWIWVGTWGGGLHLLLTEKDNGKKETKFRRFSLADNTSAQNVWKIYQDNQKRYWIGAHGGGLFLLQLPANASNHLAKQDWTPQVHNYIENGDDKESISSNSVQDILQDRTGKLWIATGFGLNCVEEKYLPDPEKYNAITTNRPELKFVKFHFTSQDIYSIADNNVLEILEDEQGLMWFATANGVSAYNWYTSQFDTHAIFNEGKKTTNAKNIYIDEQGTMWIGGGQYGLMQYLPESGKKKDFIKEHPEIFLDDYVSSILNKDDKMYVATKKGLSVFNLKNYQYKKYPLPAWIQDIITDFYVQFIFVDSRNKIWLGTEIGLFSIDQETREYSDYFRDASNPYSISDNSTNDMVEDAEGNLWIATYNGLNKVAAADRDTFKCTHFFYDKEHSENTIIGNQIISLALIGKELYLGSTAGLGSYNLETEKFKNYSVNSHKFWIQSIEPTKDGNFWASSTLGLCYFDTKKEKFNVFEKIDGLPDLSFLLGSSAQDNEGYIYFGNRSGFIRFHSEQFSQNTEKPKVYLTNIKKVNQEGEKMFSGTNKQELEMNHDDYYLSIDFAALNYNRGEKNQYAYKLEGFDDTWKPTQFGIPIVYTNLEPATYIFRVKAANNDGVWNEEGATLKIIKYPAFWETWWFRLGVLLLSFMTLAGGVYLYTNSIRKKNLTLKTYNNKLNKEIEDRKKVEKALAHKEKFSQLIMNNVPQFIYWVDENYDFLGGNRTFQRYLSLKKNSDLVGKNLSDFYIQGKEFSEEMVLLKQVMETEKPVYSKVSLSHPSLQLTQIWVERHFVPLRNDDGVVIGMLVSGRDISDRVVKEQVIAKHSEKLEEYNNELKRSNKDLEQFAYIASHDLKEPLRMIGNFSGLLARAYKTKLDKDAFEYINFIEDGVSRMSSLINSLLTYSRVGRKEMKLKDINLNKLVEVKLFDLSELIKDRNAVIEMDELPTIFGEKEQVGMVFYNLINNGIKFNKKEEPKISIKYHENVLEGFWQFSVKDNGIGIEPQYQQQIFEIFRRLHNKRDFEGTGIGLSVCQKIIFRHGGKIWLESISGQGTTFYFTISKNLKNILPAPEKEMPMPASLS